MREGRSMRSTDIQSLILYLREIAPDFFAAHMRPASPEDLAHLEVAASRTLPGYHRDMLLAMGHTPTDALNPFLNGRGFSIEELITGYADLAEYGANMSQQISLFSTADSFSEFLFLRQTEDSMGSPVLGSLDLDSGEFLPHHIGTLEHYLVSFAFAFRLAQFDHVRTFAPRRHSDPDPALAVLHRMGLAPVFEIAQGRTCMEGNQMAAVVHFDGSGQVASNDRRVLLDLCELLDDHADSESKPSPDRLVAPKH